MRRKPDEDTVKAAGRAESKLAAAVKKAGEQLTALGKLHRSFLEARKELDERLKRAEEFIGAAKLKDWLGKESQCRHLVSRLGSVAEWVSGRHLLLERDLEGRFKDSEISFIVSRNADLGPAAARTFAYYVSERAASAKDPDAPVHIGVSGGRTLVRLAECLAERFHRLVLFPLSGVGLQEDVQASVNTVVHEFASSILRAGGSVQATARWVDTLAWLNLGNIGGRAELMRQLGKSVHDISFAFTGIGALDAAAGDALPRIMDDDTVRKMLWAQIEHPEMYPDGPPYFKDILEEHDLVADILSRPIDSKGRVVSDEWLDKAVFGAWPAQPWNRRAKVHPTLFEARHRDRDPAKVIAVAGGARKAKAILAACRGKLIDVLVTDVSAARRIIELSKA